MGGDKGGVGGDEEGGALAVAVYGHGVAECRCGGQTATRYMADNNNQRRCVVMSHLRASRKLI